MAEKYEASIDLFTVILMFSCTSTCTYILYIYLTQFYELKVNIVELNNCPYNMLFQIYYSGRILLINKQNLVCTINKAFNVVMYIM